MDGRQETIAKLMANVDKDDRDKMFKAIRAFAGEDGWWKSGGEEDYRLIALEMYIHIHDADRVIALLERAYWRARDEAGG